MAPQAETNRVDIRHSQETAWNETPATPTMLSLPYTSESLKYDKRTVQSNLVRADRLIDDIIEVGAGSSGDLNFEYKFGDFDKLVVQCLAIGLVDRADGLGHFAQVAEEDVAAFAFVFHVEPAAQVHTQLASHGLQGQPQLLLDLGISGHGFFRLASERHPDAGHVDRHGDRAGRSR